MKEKTKRTLAKVSTCVAAALAPAAVCPMLVMNYVIRRKRDQRLEDDVEGDRRLLATNAVVGAAAGALLYGGAAPVVLLAAPVAACLTYLFRKSSPDAVESAECKGNGDYIDVECDAEEHE